MSSLTEEQRKRIEENRRIALQKRAQATARASSSQPGSGLPVPRLSNPVSTRIFNGNPSVSSQPIIGSVQRSFNAPTRSPAPGSSSFQGRSGIPADKFYSGPMITGTMKLISRDRFVADIGYHAECITLFKQVPGCKYDPTAKRWTFPLSQHSRVMEIIASLKPQVTASPLPSFVLRVFRAADSEPRIPEVDLSRIDPTLVAALMPFQRQGVCFGISRKGRLLIADDMGLGKTIQALGIAHYYYSEWPLLIVTPSSMRYTWRDSIWEWLPSVPAGGICVVESKQDVLLHAKVLIFSYDLLQRRAEESPVKNCKVIIMDESHHLKNWKTARAKAAAPLIQYANRAILLSGTPALSRPIELFTQINAINRNIFLNVNDFGIRYCAGKKNPYGWDYSGSSNMEELQLILEETVMIRRMKHDVLKELPSKRRKMVVLDPKLIQLKNEGLQQKATAYMDAQEKKNRHGKLLEYYSETGKIKIAAVQNYIMDLVESGNKFLCFSHHRAMMDGICEVLDADKRRYIRIDGETPSEQRKIMCDSFQEDPSIQVAVLSITSANAGITLTAASLVVFAELFWNPGILTQAEDRAHRIGQMDSVVVQYLVAKGTADDDLWSLVVEKLDVLNKAGLTKDNFREADYELFTNSVPNSRHQKQRISPSKSSQKQIHNFFEVIPSSQSSYVSPTVNREEGCESPDPFEESCVIPATQEMKPLSGKVSPDPFEESCVIPATQEMKPLSGIASPDPFEETVEINDEDLPEEDFFKDDFNSTDAEDSLMEYVNAEGFEDDENSRKSTDSDTIPVKKRK